MSQKGHIKLHQTPVKPMNKKKLSYISIHNSPRSSLIPEHFGLTRIDLDATPSFWEALNLKTILRFLSVLRTKKITQIPEPVWLEYDGNPLVNFAILMFLRKKRIRIDCHNSAVEKQKEKKTKYLISLIYLKFVTKILKVQLIVHNNQIKKKFPLRCKMLVTPYPDLNHYISDKKVNDVIFISSMNSDEPIELMIACCESLSASNIECKITGDSRRLCNDLKERGKKFFTNFLERDMYLELLAQSKVAVALTTRNNTLLFSPREAIALQVPVILTDNAANREFYLDKGSFCMNEERSLIAAIKSDLT